MQLKWPMLWDLFSLFPAHAGVIPPNGESSNLHKTFPRTRGGDPVLAESTTASMAFSPHTRG